MKLDLLAVAAALVCAGAAVAEPMPLPRVDFDGEWQINSANSMSKAHVYYSAALSVFRIDMTTSGGETSMVRDMAKGQALVWGGLGDGVAMKFSVPSQNSDVKATGDINDVDGEECEYWKGEDLKVCLSQDGIALRTVAHGRIVQLRNLERKDQDAALFALPDGLQLIEMPSDMLDQLEKQGSMPSRSLLLY